MNQIYNYRDFFEYQKFIIEITTKKTHNQLIKLPSYGRFLGANYFLEDVIMSNTALIKYMTPQVKNE